MMWFIVIGAVIGTFFLGGIMGLTRPSVGLYGDTNWSMDLYQRRQKERAQIEIELKILQAKFEHISRLKKMSQYETKTRAEGRKFKDKG